MRTSQNNIASQRCNQKIGFTIVPQVFQDVQQRRQDGQIHPDRRIFLSYTRNLF